MATWDRDGFAVWAKPLGEGTYAMPLGETAGKRREITPLNWARFFQESI